MAFNITFYNCNAENERVDKIDFLSNAISKNIELKRPTDIMHPIILVSFNPLKDGLNYCKISTFNNRYYYIDDVKWVNGVWSLSLTCDVLMSYKGSIKKQNAIICKQEKDGDYTNKMYNDGTFISEEAIKIKYIDFPNKLTTRDGTSGMPSTVWLVTVV